MMKILTLMGEIVRQILELYNNDLRKQIDCYAFRVDAGGED